MNLKSDTTLESATDNGLPLPVVTEDYDGSIWILVEPCGHFCVNRIAIVASSWESAHGAALDELTTIPLAELHEAYVDPRKEHYDCFDSRESFDTYLATITGPTGDIDQYPEMVEGYYHQDNSTGTGIVSLDPSFNLIEYDKERFPDIQLNIQADE